MYADSMMVEAPDEEGELEQELPMADENKVDDILIHYSSLLNIAPELEADKLTTIVSDCKRIVDEDAATRQAWLDKMAKAMKLAKQIHETKNEPWENAANVKYPLITDAALQFASRTAPEIIKGNRIVKTSFYKEELMDLSGMPPDSPEAQTIQKQNQMLEMKNNKLMQAAKRLSEHMSFQLLVESDEWQTNTDKLFHVLPIVGTVFKKVCYDTIKKRPSSKLCLPDDIIINNYIDSLENARSITHRIFLMRNQLVQNIRQGFFLDVDIEKFFVGDDSANNGERPLSESNSAGDYGKNPLVAVFEQHCFIDLDDDGYEEPYIVTYSEDTNQLLRIQAAYEYSPENILKNDKGQIYHIKRKNYFVDFHFIPSMDGTFYSIGYGSLLYHQNEVINTLLNQLLDAGTMSNLQCGWIGQTNRQWKGDTRFKPNEWKSMPVQYGSSLKDSILPLPVREPSQVLLTLLTMLIQSGEGTASVIDMMNNQKTQNSPNLTTVAFMEQALKVDAAIIKRLYVWFKKEFELIRDINSEYLDPQVDFISGQDVNRVYQGDYQNENIAIFPVADPNLSSSAMRMMRAQQIFETRSSPVANQREILLRFYEAMEVENPEQLVLPEPPPDAPPPPDMQLIMMQIELAKAQTALALAKAKSEPIRAETSLLNAQAIIALNASTNLRNKTSSITDIATTVATVGEKQFVEAEKDESEIQQTMSPNAENIQQIVNMLTPRIGDPNNALENQSARQAAQVNPIQSGDTIENNPPPEMLQERIIQNASANPSVDTSSL